MWDPEETHWTEDPEYFESVAWPEYLLTMEEVKSISSEIKLLDSNKASIDQNFELVLKDILDKINQ